MNQKYLDLCEIIKEMGNVSVALNAYESLPKRVVKTKVKKTTKKI